VLEDIELSSRDVDVPIAAVAAAAAVAIIACETEIISGSIEGTFL
jgi:hypothetical protein